MSEPTVAQILNDAGGFVRCTFCGEFITADQGEFAVREAMCRYCQLAQLEDLDDDEFQQTTGWSRPCTCHCHDDEAAFRIADIYPERRATTVEGNPPMNTTEMDGAALVQRHWPYDGPHSPERTADALDALSALMRYANNATSTPHGLGLAPQVYTALGGLIEGTERLPQLCSQLGDWAKRTETDSTVRHDEHRGDGDHGEAAGQQAAREAYDLLHSAALQAGALADTLSRVRSEMAHLCHDLPEE